MNFMPGQAAEPVMAKSLAVLTMAFLASTLVMTPGGREGGLDKIKKRARKSYSHLSLQFLQCRPLLPCREKLFFCCLETFPPNFQPFLKTLVMDISESVSDGQHFPALYFFCKVYIFPIFSLKSSRTIISTDS